MQIFYAPDLLESTFRNLSESESHHIVQVLRIKIGEHIKLTDGKGTMATAVLTGVEKKHCQVKILDVVHVPKDFNCSIQIAIAPVKSMDRFDWFLEKSCELGIDKIKPVLTNNCERNKLNIEKCKTRLVSAMKQSGRAWLPEISEVVHFNKYISGNDINTQKFIAYCGQNQKTFLFNAIKKRLNTEILIGPEGDFTYQEFEQALSNNWLPVTLGNYTLRTETAGLSALMQYNLVNTLE